MKLLLSLALTLIFAAAVNGGSLPPMTIPAGVSVNIHFITGHERDLKMIAAAGFKFVRMDFFWSSMERSKGIYNWADYDTLTRNLQQNGLRPYFILDYSNPLYDKTVISTNPINHQAESVLESPQTPESVAAFARFAAAAAVHFRGQGVIWEIWNEPNISFWKPRPDAAQYLTLALATARAVRAANPQACLVAPACSTFDWKFLQTMCKSGLLDYLDAVSVHPYRGDKPPETAAADYSRLRSLIDHYARADRRIPILSGEWGYSTCTKGVSLQTQADYIVRQQLSDLLNGIPLSNWYDWKNDGRDPAENEDNFGIVDFDLKPKPAYDAIQKMTRELSGYSFARRYNLGSTNDFVLVLTNSAGHVKLAMWTLTGPHSIVYEHRWIFGLGQTPHYVQVR